MTNPYQTPEGQLSTDSDAYGDVKFFSPSSRINRLRYFAHSMVFMLCSFALLGLAVGIGFTLSPAAGFVIGVPLYIAMFVFSFILIIQRLHDLNKSGWMSLLILVPLANIYLTIIIMFFKGTPGSNDYGLQTPPNKTWHWVLASMIPVLMALSIMAGIVMPSVIERLDAAQAGGYENSAELPVEYMGEGVTEDSSYVDDAASTDDASVMNDDVIDEVTSDDVEELSEEEAVLEELNSDTPQ